MALIFFLVYFSSFSSWLLFFHGRNKQTKTRTCTQKEKLRMGDKWEKKQAGEREIMVWLGGVFRRNGTE
jgi:hypothetical protein